MDAPTASLFNVDDSQEYSTVFNFTKISKPFKLGGVFFVTIEQKKGGKFVKIESNLSSLNISQNKNGSVPTWHDAICILKQLPSAPCKPKEKKIVEDIAQEIFVHSGRKIKNSELLPETWQGIEKKSESLVNKLADEPVIHSLLTFRDEIRTASNSHKLRKIKKYGVDLETGKLDLMQFFKRLSEVLCKDIAENISKKATEALNWDLSNIEEKIGKKYKSLSQNSSKSSPHEVFSPLFSYKTYLSDFFLDKESKERSVIISRLLGSSREDPSCLHLLFDETAAVASDFSKKSADNYTEESFSFLSKYFRFTKEEDELVYFVFKTIQEAHFRKEDLPVEDSGEVKDDYEPINIPVSLVLQSGKLSEENTPKEVRNLMTSIANHILYTLSQKYLESRSS